ncbi:MAG: tape measure protein [Oscillospiraceae bacterium]|nr:tape measure protein [Oscillospiraceae bacterium]
MTVAELVASIFYETDPNSKSQAEKTASETAENISEAFSKTFGTIKQAAVQALSVLGIGISLKSLNRTAEEYGNINDKIRAATKELGDQEEIQKKILDTANETRLSYSQTSDIVAKLLKSAPASFSSVDEATEFTALTGKLFKASGMEDSQIASLQNSIADSFAKGAVSSQTVGTMLTSAPEAAKYLAETVGTTTDKLEKLASSGGISLEQLKRAFVNNADTINAAFAETDLSVSDSLQIIKDRWGNFVDDFNSSFGITKTVANGMVKVFDVIMAGLYKAKEALEKVADKLGGTENLLKLVSGLILTFAGSAVGAKFISVLKAVASAFGLINKKGMGLKLLLLAIFLVIDDFINFMQGNDSLMGSLFEKMGINADDVRQIFIDLWDSIKGTLPTLQRLGSALLTTLAKLWEIIQPVFELIAEFLVLALPLIAETLTDIIDNGIIPMLEGIIDFLNGDFEKGLQEFSDGFCNTFDSCLKFVDSLFGTHLSEWYNEVKEFWKGFGSYLYQITHADEINELDLQNKYGDMDSDVRMRSNALMRAGMSAEDALNQAIDEIVDTNEKLYYWQQHFADTVNSEDAESRRRQMEENGSLNLNFYTADELAALGLDLEKLSPTYGSTADGAYNYAANTSNTSNITVNNETTTNIYGTSDENIDRAVDAIEGAADNSVDILARGVQYGG